MIASFFAALALLLCACEDEYDDSALWKGVNDAYNDMTDIAAALDEIEAQITLIATVVDDGVITSITENEDGGYTVRYKGEDNVEYTVVIASKDDVVNAPIIGVTEVDGVLYWTTTSNGVTTILTDVDGEKIPVAGRTPSITVDSEGYWMVNGNYIYDSEGNKIMSEGKSSSVITDISFDEDGNVVLTLPDGSTVTVEVFDAFSVAVYANDTEIIDTYKVSDIEEPLVLTYVISGQEASTTIAKIMREDNLSAELDSSEGTITVTFPEEFEEGHFYLMVVDADMDVIIRPVYLVSEEAVPDYYGIKTASDLANFAAAVNSGKSLTRYKDESGTVVLLSDVDMSEVTEWEPIGTYDSPFTGSFSGEGYSITNVNITYDLSSSKMAGLFGYVNGATISNVTLSGDKISLTGTCADTTYIGSVVAFAVSSTITACVNNIDQNFTGDDPASTLVMFGGIAGAGKGLIMSSSTNNGEVYVGSITNTENGSKGFMNGGLVGYLKDDSANAMTDCVNNGHVCCPSGRTGGLVGTMETATVTSCINNGLIEDDAAGQYDGVSGKYNIKRMGGLAGASTKSTSVLQSCTNAGNVITHLSCRTGGFVGHNSGGKIYDCTNTGAVIGDTYSSGSTYHGPGWACGYNSATTLISGCSGLGKIGDYSTYASNPDAAPANMHTNAVCHLYTSYDPEDNEVDWTLDEYYDWEVSETMSLHDAVTYTHYSFTNLPRHLHVLEIDLTNSDIEVTTSYADDIVPNPNANSNNNNGYNLRETLSQLCTRKISEGENVLAGVNSGFFDSNDGISRGLHIEEGVPVYVNNPAVRSSLTNHVCAFTIFTDGTASCDKKEFSGVFAVGDTEYEYYSINDTTARHTHSVYLANMITSRYVEYPHSSDSTITNPLASNAYYVVARFTSGSQMTVNTGYHEATVTALYDGTETALTTLPYLTDDDQFALILSGTTATSVSSSINVGDTIKIKADVAVNGSTDKTIYTQNSSMYKFLSSGSDNSSAASSTSTNITDYDPVTLAAVDEAGTKIWLIECDGRQDWYSMGMKSYEMYRVALKLGAYNMTRFDGGGSSSMWVYSSGAGSTVSSVSDSKGERSCLNYMYVRVKNSE